MQIARTTWRPVIAPTLLAGVLLVVWALFLANDAGDLAAQYAWTDFTKENPDTAYNLSWYGGMHTASYSVLSPYLMGWAGVRTTGVLVGTLSAAVAALLLVRVRLARPLIPALWTAFALAANVASGRVTFAVGMFFGLATTALLFPEAERRAWRSAAVFALATLSTLGSPVVGLFLEVVAAALLFTGRRREAYLLATGPVLVVAGTALLFPFTGVQPFDWYVAVLVAVVAVVTALLVPREWREIRIGSLVYAAGVVLTWALPTPIGSNVERLPLLFGGTVLLAATLERSTGRGRAAVRRTGAVGLAFLAVGTWQIVKPIGDLLSTVPVSATALDAKPLIDELRRVGADRGRVEVVPLRSHWEASGIAPYVNLARGWNRQADVARNPLFYQDPLTPEAYHAWLRNWSVGYVVLPVGPPDDAAVDEAAIVAAGHPWLNPVWHDGRWQLYQVADPTPMAAEPAIVQQAGPAAITLEVPRPGPVLLRIPWSPWLGVEGTTDALHGCLAAAGEWTLLYAPEPGTYRVGGRYSLDRGTPCLTK